MINQLVILLAQAAPTTAPAGGGAQPSPSLGSFLPLAMIAGLFAFMMLTARSQKKREKRERKEMHDRMSKSDRVLTIGGVIGTVISVKENEVVVKVDESTNTKMTFIKSAIQRVLTDDQDVSAANK